MGKVVVSAWMTLDGVFDGGTMDKWFLPFDSTERQEYIRQSIQGSDAVLFGRTTYEMLAPYWSSLKNNEMGVAAKLNGVPKYVVSSTLKKADWNNTTIIKDQVAEAITGLKKRVSGEIQIEGSATLVHSLMKSPLIDEFRFLIQPLIIGSGKRFFRDGMNTGALTLVNSRTLEKGVTLLCYKNAGA